MTLAPASLPELAQRLAQAARAHERVASVDLSALRQVLEHAPQDLTVTAQTGIDLQTLQSRLRSHGQWLPIDPPRPQATSLAEILHRDLSGPRRLGYGTVREHVLGLRTVLADGRVVASGGKVVKNVAGYDLCKLFVGSQGTLGIIVEATFKLLPLPERELFLAWHGRDLPAALEQLELVLTLPITPVALDLHNLAGNGITLVCCLAGAVEEVEAQAAELHPLGFDTTTALNHQDALDPAKVYRHSALPSRLGKLLAEMSNTRWVARAGNGVVYAEGGARPVPCPIPLTERVKALFDPNGVLPAASW